MPFNLLHAICRLLLCERRLFSVQKVTCGGAKGRLRRGVPPKYKLLQFTARCFRVSPFLANFALMNRLLPLCLALVLACSCGRQTPEGATFTIETLNKTTPVKDQGRSPLCWLYAMLATIESDRLMLGDSVNLSPHFVARAMLADMATRRYLTRGGSAVTADGTAADALACIAEYGLMPYDAYRSECNYSALCRKLKAVAGSAAARKAGVESMAGTVEYTLDTAIGPLPRHIWMYGMEYTPAQFAGSILSPSDYVPMTSYTHKPFWHDVVLDVPANRRGLRFLNVPVDTLAARVEAALRSGRSVCWEGDITNAGFSFDEGVARLPGQPVRVTQDMRQRAFERFEVTDDHCMELIGTARDARGGLYFVCKNSWGTDNPYGGLMYMSLPYFRLNTVAVVVKRLQ